MERSLNVELRPQKLEDFIGCEKIIGPIKEGIRQGRVDNTYVFTGTPGTGKTSMARIIAQLVQGKVQDQYDIEEVDTGDMSADDIRELCGRSRNNPWFGKYRCIILDEAHKLAPAAMTILLKHLEEPVPSTVWFVCSSEAAKLPAAVMRRGSHYVMPELSLNQVDSLVQFAIKHVGGDVEIKYLKSDKYKELLDALNKQEVFSPGFVIRAVEKFITGIAANEAARTSEATVFDAFAVAKATAAGDWSKVKTLLLGAPPSAGRDIRGRVSGYFRSILMKEPAGSKRAEQCVEAIRLMADLANQSQFEEGMIMAATCAAIYEICASQTKFKQGS